MQVAQPAFALFYIGFDNIARIAVPRMSEIAFGQLHLGEISRLHAPDLPPEGAIQIV